MVEREEMVTTPDGEMLTFIFHPEHDGPRARRDGHRCHRPGRIDALAAHDDDPAGLHSLAVEHTIGLQHDDRRSGLLRRDRRRQPDTGERRQSESR